MCHARKKIVMSFFYRGKIMKLKMQLACVALALGASVVYVVFFVNGGFESGDISGWVIGIGYCGNIDNVNLNFVDFLFGGVQYNVVLNYLVVVGVGITPFT